ncbi:MAG TPA: endolytic transglycosylase MltG [Acidimicrobiia bacterium]|nr:endolytic transglycosylase MltG [Acidimicrobiia bacterium]
MITDDPTTVTDEAQAPPEGRRGGRRPSWGRILLGAALGVVLLLGLFGFWLVRQINPPGGPGDPVAIEIPQGASATAVARILDDEGVITSERIFRIYARVTGAGEFQAGIYRKGEFRRDMSMGDAISALEAGPVIEYVRLTVPEGFTLAQIAERVGELEGRSGERFLELANSGEIRSRFQPAGSTNLEGLLFPDTYQVAEDEDEAGILRRMVSQFEAVADEVGLEAKAATVGLSPYEAIVVASLIEEETRIADERELVSAVIHNRLEKGMLLQIDATVLYALGEHKNRVLFRDLEVDSPYNTYRTPGLPPTPIAAPGAGALQAAVEPADVAFLFYVKTDEDGRHAFAETAAEHERNVADARRRGVR